jgi:hypothetical protein
MATAPNKATGQVDVSFIAPNRKVAALDMPRYAGEVVINTTNQNCYVAVPPVPQAGLATTDWVLYSYGTGLN